MGRLFAAVQFLTVIPAPSGGPPARAVIFFPMVGAGLGVGAGAIRVYAPLPPTIASLLALGFLGGGDGGPHWGGRRGAGVGRGRDPDVRAAAADDRVAARAGISGGGDRSAA